MSTAYIGPVAVDHLDPSASWQSDADGMGIRSTSLGGMVEWTQAHQLSELVANQDRLVTIAGLTGVLEWVHTDDVLMGPFKGWHLLQTVAVSPAHSHSLAGVTGPAPFSLTAASLGPCEVVVVHSARGLANDFGLLGQAVVAAPFWPEDTGQLLVTVGGTTIAREYDETT